MTVAGLGDIAMEPGVDPTETTRSYPDYSPAIYGSLLVTTLIAIQWHHEAVPERIALTLISSVAVFWLMHVWSEVVNRRLHGPMDNSHVIALARHEASILAAAVVPAIVLVLARFLGAPLDTTIAIALVVCIGQLFVGGLAVGLVAHSSRAMALRVALVDGGLGIAIIGLKLLILS